MLADPGSSRDTALGLVARRTPCDPPGKGVEDRPRDANVLGRLDVVSRIPQGRGAALNLASDGRAQNPGALCTSHGARTLDRGSPPKGEIGIRRFELTEPRRFRLFE
jgi:hypothetical protein